MLQATFKISGIELTMEFLEKIKSLFLGDSKNFEVTISVRPKETLEATRLRIDQPIENIEKNRNMVDFSSEEYEQLVNKFSRQ